MCCFVKFTFKKIGYLKNARAHGSTHLSTVSSVTNFIVKVNWCDRKNDFGIINNNNFTRSEFSQNYKKHTVLLVNPVYLLLSVMARH